MNLNDQKEQHTSVKCITMQSSNLNYSSKQKTDFLNDWDLSDAAAIFLHTTNESSEYVRLTRCYLASKLEKESMYVNQIEHKR